jgi:hypothetical protein
MRAFVRLREILTTHEELARKVAQHDRQITALFEHVKTLYAITGGTKGANLTKVESETAGPTSQYVRQASRLSESPRPLASGGAEVW